MKTLLSFFLLGVSLVSAEEITVPAGEVRTFPVGHTFKGDVLIKKGLGTLDLSGVALLNQGLEIQEGDVLIAATGASQITASAVRFTVQKSRPGKGGAPEFANSGSQISEFQLYRTKKIIPLPAGSTATSRTPDDASREGAPMAIDGRVDTKWYGAYNQPLQINLAAPVTMDGYSFATANDAIGRDPFCWLVEAGSFRNGKMVWTTIDTQQNYAAPVARRKPVGTVFPVRIKDVIPYEYPLTVGPKGKLILKGATEVAESVAGCGVIELRGSSLRFLESAPFTGTVFGDGTVQYPRD